MPVSNEWLDQNAGNFPRETQAAIAEELKNLRARIASMNNAAALVADNQRQRAAIRDALRALNSVDTITAVQILHAAFESETIPKVLNEAGTAVYPAYSVSDIDDDGMPAETEAKP